MLNLKRLLKKKLCQFDKEGKGIPIDKQKEIFYKCVEEKTKEREKLCNSVNFKYLACISFSGFH